MRQEAGGQALHSLPKPVFVWDLQFKYLLQTYYVPNPLLRILTHGLFEFPSYKGEICKKPVGFTGLLRVIALTRPREELRYLRAGHQCRRPDSGLSCSYIVIPFISSVALIGWRNPYSWHQETALQVLIFRQRCGQGGDLPSDLCSCSWLCRIGQLSAEVLVTWGQMQSYKWKLETWAWDLSLLYFLLLSYYSTPYDSNSGVSWGGKGMSQPGETRGENALYPWMNSQDGLPSDKPRGFTGLL